MLKYNLYCLLFISLFSSCKEVNEASHQPVEDGSNAIATERYPENLTKVFEAHGGLDTWKSMETLIFTMVAEDGESIITTDLQSRMALIEAKNFSIGYDGDSAWVHQDSTYFDGDPVFYYDLMFYFYAMPFILSDDGINYTDAEPLHYNGIDYPGIKITYDSGVGASPKDEYILYYNPDTYNMSWLSYTVTYFSNEKSDKFRYINYNTWQNVNGLLLPESMQWYGFENGSLTSMQNERNFIDASLSKDKMPVSTYQKPKDKKE